MTKQLNVCFFNIVMNSLELKEKNIPNLLGISFFSQFHNFVEIPRNWENNALVFTIAGYDSSLIALGFTEFSQVHLLDFVCFGSFNWLSFLRTIFSMPDVLGFPGQPLETGFCFYILFTISECYTLLRFFKILNLKSNLNIIKHLCFHLNCILLCSLLFYHKSCNLKL